MPDPDVKQLSNKELSALEQWYLGTFKKPLPSRLLRGGLVRLSDPIYEAFVAAGKPGYVPPGGSADWLAQQQPAWLGKDKFSPERWGDTLPAPEITSPEPEVTLPTLPKPYQWEVPGQVIFDTNTNKYYYTGGAVE